MKRLIIVKAMALLTGVLLVSVGHADQSRHKFDDPREKSLEAGTVSLIQNAKGRVVEVRVTDCELCDRSSYLPHPDLEVEVSGEDIPKSDIARFSGDSGTIVFNQRDYMVFGVYYWGQHSMEDSQ